MVSLAGCGETTQISARCHLGLNHLMSMVEAMDTCLQGHNIPPNPKDAPTCPLNPRFVWNAAIPDASPFASYLPDVRGCGFATLGGSPETESRPAPTHHLTRRGCWGASPSSFRHSVQGRDRPGCERLLDPAHLFFDSGQIVAPRFSNLRTKARPASGNQASLHPVVQRILYMPSALPLGWGNDLPGGAFFE